MSYYISEKQHLAANKERSTYAPYIIDIPGIVRHDTPIKYGHPLYISICDVFELENSTDRPITYPIIPDGCISLIFSGINLPESGRICGSTDRLKKIVMRPGEKILYIRFMPGACASFTNCEINTLTNTSANEESVVKNGDRLMAIAGRDLPIQEKTTLMSRVLRTEKKENETGYLIRFCVERILKREGNIMVGELAKDTGFSERYLGKVFEKHLGISPKTYIEIIRIQISLKRLAISPPKSSLLDLALDSGYFDHSHMNRHYNKFLNCSSGTLRNKGFEKLDYSDVESYI